jgi:hypothetical protein
MDFDLRRAEAAAKEGAMKTLMLASAIIVGLSASADAREIFLFCRTDGAAPYLRFDIGVDLEASVLTFYYDQEHSSRFRATITPDYIQYHQAMTTTRFDRKTGDWVGWTYAGTMNGKGSCQITDDRRRLEEDLLPVVKPLLPVVKP